MPQPSTGWIALEFESLLNAAFRGEPPEEGSLQHRQLENFFFAGALTGMNPDNRESMAAELALFLERRQAELPADEALLLAQELAQEQASLALAGPVQ